MKKRLRKVYDKATYETIVDGLKSSEEAHKKVKELYEENPKINYKITCYDEQFENEMFIENYQGLLHKYFQIKNPSLHSIESLWKEFDYAEMYMDRDNCFYLMDNYDKYQKFLSSNQYSNDNKTI